MPIALRVPPSSARQRRSPVGLSCSPRASPVCVCVSLSAVQAFPASVHVDVRGGSPSLSSHSSQQPHPASSTGGERRYASLYAESVNPFTAFKARALQQSERNLPPSERLTLSIARLVFSRRAARTFAFAYACVLHVLIFIVLYTHTAMDHCGPREKHLELP